MSQALAQSTSMKSVSRTNTVRPFTSSSKPVVAPHRRMVVNAAKGDTGAEKGPNPMLMKVVSAAAAVQLALIPVAGNAYADISDILPETAKSGAARAELNQKTSDLPSFKDVGDSLQKNLGFGDDPKNIGKAIDQNTPDVDLTKNPKDVAKDIGRAIDRNTPDLPSPGDLARKVDRNTPDLPSANEVGNKAQNAVSGSNNPLDSIKNAFTGSNTPDLPSPGDVGRAVDRNTPDLPSNNPVESLKNAFTGSSRPDLPSPGDVGRAIDRNTPDLPSPNDLARKVDRNTPDLPSANELGNKAQNAVSGGGSNPLQSLKDAFTGSSRPDLPSAGDVGRAIDRNTPDLPSPGEAANKAKDAVGGGSGGLPNPFEAVKNAVSGSPDLPDPRAAASKVTGSAPDLKGAAKDVKGKVESATPSFSNPFKGFGGGGGLPGSNVDTSISTKPL